MKKHVGTVIKFTLSLGLGIGIIWFTFSKLSDADKQLMYQSFMNANYYWLILGALFNLVSNFFRTERWRMLLQPIGYNPGFANTFFSVMVMYFANLLFPRLGEVMRCGILRKYEKIPVDKSIGTMVTERLMDVLTLPVIIGLLIIAEKDKFFESLNNTQAITKQFGNSPVYSYIFYSVLLLVVLFVIYKVITDKEWVNRIKTFLLGIWIGLKSVLNTKSPALFIIYSIAIWLCYFLASYCSFFALTETAQLSPWVALGVLFFGALAVAAVQGGIGVYPLVVGKFLMVYGVAESIGLSFGWLAWSFQTGLIIIAGILSLIILSVINKS